MLKVPFNSSDVFVPPSLLYMKYLPLHHNTSGPARKYMLSAVINQCIYIFVFHPCVLNLIRLMLYSKTLTSLSVCPAVIVLSVHTLKDIVLNGTACCRIACRSVRNRAVFNDSWDDLNLWASLRHMGLLFGAFLLKLLLHLSYICLHSEIRIS